MEQPRRRARLRQNFLSRAVGFSLVELMVVVAIVALLATLALPAYRDYSVRARVAEALNLAALAKSVVAENAILGLRDLSLGVAGPGIDGAPPTRNVAALAVAAASGEITVTTTAIAGGGSLVFIPSAAGSPLKAGELPAAALVWRCDGGDLAARYRPATCRAASSY